MRKLLLLFYLLLFSSEHALSSKIRPIAIVTGGTRGIGSGIAQVLAEDGYDLLLTYNTDQVSATKFAQSLVDVDKATCTSSNSSPIRVECVGGDISLSSTRDEIFKRLDYMMKHDNESTLAILVHNAGQYVGITSDNVENIKAGKKPLAFGDGSLIGDDGRTNFETMHYYQRMYGEAFIDLSERSLARMDQSGANGGGSIVGISSPGVTAHYYGPDPGYSMPGSGKCLMEYSMRIYAAKVAHRGINVNVIVPGVTKTAAWNRLAKSMGMEDEMKMMDGLVQNRVPLKKMIEPRDIGGVVKFLCSDVGKFITGIVLPMDGGLHLKR